MRIINPYTQYIRITNPNGRMMKRCFDFAQHDSDLIFIITPSRRIVIRQEGEFLILYTTDRVCFNDTTRRLVNGTAHHGKKYPYSPIVDYT